MRGIEDIIEATEERLCAVKDMMRENTKDLGRRVMLLNMVMIVKTGVGPPADVKGGIHMGFAPLHDLNKLGPVFNILKIIVFYGSAGNDHAVIALVLNLIECCIKRIQIFR